MAKVDDNYENPPQLGIVCADKETRGSRKHSPSEFPLEKGDSSQIQRTGHYLGSWEEPGIEGTVRLRVEHPREARIAPPA